MAKLWGVIPAAGIGSRMQSDRPKQYLPLGGRPIIEHAIASLLPHVHRVVVALADHDEWWRPPATRQLVTCSGGEERVHSVLSALNTLIDLGAEPDDWVLVHDAARPLLSAEDVCQLIKHTKSSNASAAILATPVIDTIKRSSDHIKIDQTIDRSNLWRALTPQLAPVSVLRGALNSALDAGVKVTDEASALEFCGYDVAIIEGSSSNLKITLPTDLLLAEALLKGTNP